MCRENICELLRDSMSRNELSEGLFSALCNNLRGDPVSSRWDESTKNRSPHKPLLLLAICDMYEQGIYSDEFVELNQELIDVFAAYWNAALPHKRRSPMALPFYHLKSAPFWSIIPKEGVVMPNSQIRSNRKLQDLLAGAKVDEELHRSLIDESLRNRVRNTLYEKYFSVEASARMIEFSSLNIESHNYSLELLGKSKDASKMNQIIRV